MLMHTREVAMGESDWDGAVTIGFYRRANGKRPWRIEGLGVILEMVRTGDLWKQGDGLLRGLTVEAVARATALEAAWAAEVAPAQEGDRGNPAHATYYERKGEYGKLKSGTGAQTLSGGTFSGVYQGCRDSGMESHSGIIVYDLDHLSRLGEAASDVRDRCRHIESVAFAFVSPSGDGLKVGVLVSPVPQTREEHLTAWEQGRARLMEDLGIPIDVSDVQAKNPSRLCFLGYDPDIYIADPETVEAVPVDLTTGTAHTISIDPGVGKHFAMTALSASVGGMGEGGFDDSTNPQTSIQPSPDRWRHACPWLEEVSGQLQGRCPECGGHDRFHVNLAGPHLWECRKCHEAGRGTWPWFAAFTPWYRPGDFTGPGKNGPWECSPDADCLRLIRRHADELLLVESDEGGQFILMADNGHGVWRPSESRLTALLLMTTREWYHASADAGLSEHMAARIARWAVSTARHKARAEALASVSAVAGWLTESGSWPQGLTRARESDLDRPGALYIGAPNGAVGLAERRLLTGAEARSKLISRMITDDYDPDATHPDVDLLFSHLDPLDREYFLGSMGFGMRSRPSRRFLFLDGIGNDGKSTMFNAVVLCLGDYAGVPQAQAMFNARQERPDAPSAYLLSFQELPLCFIAEPPTNNFNWALVRRISGGDMAGARQPHAPVEIHRKAQYVSTLIFCTNPDTKPVPPPMATLAMYDRYRPIDYPHIPEVRQVEQLPNRLREKPARQALASLIIRHSMRHLDGPPPDSPAVARNRRQVRRESLGECGEWLLSRVIKTGDAADRLTTDQLWEAAVEASHASIDDGVTAWGMTRRQLTDYAKLLFGMGPPVRGRVQGKVCHYWRRHRLLSEGDVADAMELRLDARRETAAAQPVVYSSTYCRVCRIMILMPEEELYLARHTEEDLLKQHPCFRCGALLPARAPYQLLCADCAGKTAEIWENRLAVVAGIAEEAKRPAGGMGACLQAQTYRARSRIQEDLEAELEEEEDLWLPGMQRDDLEMEVPQDQEEGQNAG